MDFLASSIGGFDSYTDETRRRMMTMFESVYAKKGIAGMAYLKRWVDVTNQIRNDYMRADQIKHKTPNMMMYDFWVGTTYEMWACLLEYQHEGLDVVEIFDTLMTKQAEYWNLVKRFGRRDHFDRWIRLQRSLFFESDTMSSSLDTVRNFTSWFNTMTKIMTTLCKYKKDGAKTIQLLHKVEGMIFDLARSEDYCVEESIHVVEQWHENQYRIWTSCVKDKDLKAFVQSLKKTYEKAKTSSLSEFMSSCTSSRIRH